MSHPKGKAPKPVPFVFIRDMPDISWHQRAACDRVNNPTADPRDFSGLPPGQARQNPDRHPSVLRAKEICSTCPVTRECRQQAAEDIHAEGVWGGWYWSDTRRKHLKNMLQKLKGTA